MLSNEYPQMHAPSIQHTIQQLQKRLAQLQDEAEDELRQRPKEACTEVTLLAIHQSSSLLPLT
jgi:hypothetical protein